MADISPASRRADRRLPPPERSVVELIRDRTLDAELAATVWVLIDGRVPLIVAARADESGALALLHALLDLVPGDIHRIELAGADERFEWLPQAPDLGWPRASLSAAPRPVAPVAAARPTATARSRPAATARSSSPVRPETTVIVAPRLAGRDPSATGGPAARIAVRAASIGYGLAATIEGDSLEDVFATLERAPLALTDDERSRLGVVLVLRDTEPGDRPRIVAAHYVRPVARDEHGHVQRLGPAVLATWDPAGDRFEHFGWGITPELARRVGRRAGDFELEVDRRRDLLADLAASGSDGVDAVRAAIDADRAAQGPAHDAIDADDPTKHPAPAPN